jgi:hypothetical protein
MDPSNSYTLSQALGKYYQDDPNEEPTLHNLSYLNKFWREGDQDRYIRQECTLPVTRVEFLRWFEKSNQRRISVFVYVTQPYPHLDVTIGELDLGEYIFKMYTGFKRTDFEGVMYIRPSRKTMNYTKEASFDMLHKALLTVDDGWYGDPKDIVTFDVVTLYSILSARGNCPQMIKNYARNLVLKIFDNFVDKFETVSFQLLRVYIFGNAFALNIDEIDSLVGGTANIYDTDNLATRLIDDIRNQIYKFD